MVTARAARFLAFCKCVCVHPLFLWSTFRNSNISDRSTHTRTLFLVPSFLFLSHSRYLILNDRLIHIKAFATKVKKWHWPPSVAVPIPTAAAAAMWRLTGENGVKAENITSTSSLFGYADACSNNMINHVQSHFLIVPLPGALSCISTYIRYVCSDGGGGGVSSATGGRVWSRSLGFFRSTQTHIH